MYGSLQHAFAMDPNDRMHRGQVDTSAWQVHGATSGPLRPLLADLHLP